MFCSSWYCLCRCLASVAFRVQPHSLAIFHTSHTSTINKHVATSA